MRKRMSAGLVAASVVALGFFACKKGNSPQELAKDIPPPSSDTDFTPPEIRRPTPSADSDQAKSASGDAAHSSDTAVRPAASAPASAPRATPVPPTVAQVEPKPAASAPGNAPALEAASSGPGDPGPDGDWVVQVSIHKSEADAKAQVAKLSAQGIRAYAIAVPTAETGLAGQYWRVRVGRFRSRSEAQSFGDHKIVPAGLKFWIDKKSNESRAGGTP